MVPRSAAARRYPQAPSAKASATRVMRNDIDSLLPHQVLHPTSKTICPNPGRCGRIEPATQDPHSATPTHCAPKPSRTLGRWCLQHCWRAWRHKQTRRAHETMTRHLFESSLFGRWKKSCTTSQQLFDQHTLRTNCASTRAPPLPQIQCWVGSCGQQLVIISGATFLPFDRGVGTVRKPPLLHAKVRLNIEFGGAEVRKPTPSEHLGHADYISLSGATFLPSTVEATTLRIQLCEISKEQVTRSLFGAR